MSPSRRRVSSCRDNDDFCGQMNAKVYVVGGEFIAQDSFVPAVTVQGTYPNHDSPTSIRDIGVLGC